MQENTPYVKKFENGILTNPITKENPYLFAPSVAFRKMFERAIGSKNRIWETSYNRFFKGKSVVKV